MSINPLPCEIEEHIEKMTIETTNEKANEEIPNKSVAISERSP
jgi:hypothetical protein